VNGGRVPRVSIGLPVYNGESQLPHALDSLLAQSLEDFEVVISDNASTDATETICRDYAARDSRIRYHRGETNRGAAWNFNHVLAISGGRYFKWASSNDIHAPHYLSRCVEILEARSEVVLCYPKSRLIDEEGAVLRDYEDNLHLPWPEPARRFAAFRERVSLCNAIFGLIRPEILRRTGGLGSYPGSDEVLLGELSLYGQFFEVPERLFYRRLEQQNVIRNQSVENWQEFFDPGSRGGIFMRTWRHQYEYLLATLRTPLSMTDKARVVSFLLRLCVIHRFTMARELTEATLRLVRRTPARRRMSGA
jgi:glycosyltransferase involved in cell wall biosynthesis